MIVRATPAVSLTIALQIFEGVFQFDAVFLQEAIYLHASLVSEQAPELTRRELVFTVSLKGDGLEGRAAKVLAGGSQGRGKIVGKVEGELHVRKYIASDDVRCLATRLARARRGLVAQSFGIDSSLRSARPRGVPVARDLPCKALATLRHNEDGGCKAG